jgi:hypothetical protein
MFLNKEWHNIPKCIEDILGRLIEQTENNRMDLGVAKKRTDTLAKYVDTKCEVIVRVAALNKAELITRLASSSKDNNDKLNYSELAAEKRMSKLSEANLRLV